MVSHAPKSFVCLRQSNLAGVGAKFVELHKGLFMELLDLLLPAEAIAASSVGARYFERGCGLRTKPALVRFRILDRNLSVLDMTDIATPALRLRSFGCRSNSSSSRRMK